MTHITYFEQSEEISIEVQGHSGYAEFGKDIVCSAISVLIQTLIYYLEDNADYCDNTIQSGYVFCYAKGGDTRASFDTILTGLRLIEEQYPDYIKLEKGCTLMLYPSLI